jgi:hypothetical protein
MGVRATVIEHRIYSARIDRLRKRMAADSRLIKEDRRNGQPAENTHLNL